MSARKSSRWPCLLAALALAMLACGCHGQKGKTGASITKGSPKPPPPRPKLDGESGPESEGAESSTSMSWIVYGVVAAVLLQGGVFGYLHWKRLKLDNSPDKESLRCRCPACKRKYAYLAANAGKPVQCARCKKQFELPVPSPGSE